LPKDQHDEARKLLEPLDTAEGAEAAKPWTELKTKLAMHEELEETARLP